MSKKEEFDSLAEALAGIREELGNPADLRILFEGGCAAVYLDGLVDEKRIGVALHRFAAGNPLPEQARTVNEVAVPATDLEQLAKGWALLLGEGEHGLRLYRLAAPGWQLRPISAPLSEQLIRGAREGFTETISVNTACPITTS